MGKTQDNVGIECPDCGCRHFYVDHTKKAFNRILRYRHCRNCGRRIITVEKITGTQKKVPDMESET